MSSREGPADGADGEEVRRRREGGEGRSFAGRVSRDEAAASVVDSEDGAMMRVYSSVV